MRISDAFDGLMEALAEIEHERWAHWQNYLHGKGTMQPDGSLLIPADWVRRWQRQINTPYAELSDEEKESDREQVRCYLPVIADALKR